MTVRALPLFLLNALFVPLLLAGLAAQTGDTNERPVIHATSREVLLDLVVRDKHHHAVPDLRQEEVEVYEDGVRQKVLVFRNVQGAEQLQTERAMERRGAESKDAAVTAHAGEKTPSLNSLRELNFVSVV